MMKKIASITLFILLYGTLFCNEEYEPQPVPQEALFYKGDTVPRKEGIIASSILTATGAGLTIFSTYNLIEMGVEDQNPEMVAYTGLSLIFTGIASLLLKYFILRE